MQTSSQLGFYAKYRIPFSSITANADNNPINIAIHMVFVPLIYATAMILAGLLPPIPLASTIPPISLADVGVAVYAIGYILLEPVAGVLMLPFHLGVMYYAHTLPTQFPKDVIAKWAGALNVSAWIAQFMGHGFAEGRAPALLDNLFQVRILEC
jgi:2-hydroxy fatty acid dioxygenase